MWAVMHVSAPDFDAFLSMFHYQERNVKKKMDCDRRAANKRDNVELKSVKKSCESQ